MTKGEERVKKVVDDYRRRLEAGEKLGLKEFMKYYKLREMLKSGQIALLEKIRAKENRCDL